MKLCWLVPSDRSGGITSVAVACCRQAAKNGHSATLLTLHPPSGALDEERLPCVDSLNETGAANGAPATLMSWLAENPHDVLLLNGCGQVEPVIPHIGLETRLVYVVHDTARQYWRVPIAHASDLDCVIAVSECVRRTMETELPATLKVFVARNGVTSPLPAPVDAEVRRNDILFLGGDNPHKGANDVLRLWNALSCNLVDTRLHWIGAVSESFRKEAQRIRHSERIIFHGAVSRREVFRLAGESKVVLILTRAESFGMATVEAMTMGSIPVAWDIDTGTREILEDGVTGFLAPLGNSRKLAATVAHAISEHPSLVDRVIRRSRHEFCEEVMWKQYDNIFRLLSEPRLEPRTRQGEPPPPFVSRRHKFQLLPRFARNICRTALGASPHLSYWLRQYRGF